MTVQTETPHPQLPHPQIQTLRINMTNPAQLHAISLIPPFGKTISFLCYFHPLPSSRFQTTRATFTP
jgi:hypothetical protein